jgi:hypothetical protein
VAERRGDGGGHGHHPAAELGWARRQAERLMFVEFQTAVVAVLGDGIFIVGAFAMAGGLLIAMVHVAFGLMRRLT